MATLSPALTDELVRGVANGNDLEAIAATRPEFGSPWWLAFTLMRDNELYERCCRAAAFPDLLADDVLDLTDRLTPTPAELACAVAWLDAESP
jgi:hypothetical protein